MNLALPLVSLPLAADSKGVVQIDGTRIPIDTVVAAYNDGMNAEQIVATYGSLKLFDVYYTIGFYLQHKAEVDAYLQARERAAATARAEIERLLVRRSSGVIRKKASVNVCWPARRQEKLPDVALAIYPTRTCLMQSLMAFRGSSGI